MVQTKKHDCSLNLGSDSLLPRKKGLWCKICRSFRKLGQVSQHHPFTYDYFFSFPTVMAERQRQMFEGAYIIHPFSLFSLSWKSLMVALNVSHMVLSTFRLFYIVDPWYQRSPHPCDTAMLALNVVCWLDICVNFHMGYVEPRPEGQGIVLNRYHVACKYLRSWLILDVLSSLPIGYICVWRQVAPRYLLLAHVVPILRCARIYTVAIELTAFVKIFTKSYVWHGGLRHAVLFCLTAHWCSCLIYLPTIISFYWLGYLNTKHTQFLKRPPGGTIVDIPVVKRYSKSFFISLSGFFGTGFSMFSSTEPDEVLVHSFIILYSTMFMVYNFVFVLKVYTTVYSPSVRYHELINQVEEYMKLKQFPVSLKKRVRAFYYYRYQEKYFSENTVLGSLSEELRNQITFHTCHKLVDKVALFKGVPASVVGSILGCLHAEVYLPNDSVLRAGEIGECMFFIANGTVAVYSLKGVEVCHLEDGAHFGEVALLMRDSKRVATVVAVEITQVYRLDGKDFKKFILTNKVLYERVTAMASKRMHETVLLDEDLRRERERLQEKQPLTTTT